MKRAFTILLGCVILHCSLAGPVRAGTPCDDTTDSVVGTIFGAVCQTWGNNVPLFLCTRKNANCAPAAAAGEGCGPGGCPGLPTPTASSPINLANGNTYIQQMDVRIPGLANGLNLLRTWNSRWPSTQMASQVGLFGPNWRSTYEERVFLGNDGYMRYARGDGSFWSFGAGGPGWIVVAPANSAAILVRGNSQWTLTLKNGEQRLFDLNSGSLVSIIDRNGNTTQLTYDGLNRLITVADPVGRHLTFTYQNNTSYLITGVTSDVGLSLTYAYDTHNRLSMVTKPDQTTISFQYDSNSLITAVLDSNGKVLESHTYDSSQRGLTGSQANGVQAVTLSYTNQ